MVARCLGGIADSLEDGGCCSTRISAGAQLEMIARVLAECERKPW